MTLVLILPVWLIMLALVVGLCTAARAGDGLIARDSATDGASGAPGLQTEESTPLGRSGGVRSATGPHGRVPAQNVAA